MLIGGFALYFKNSLINWNAPNDVVIHENELVDHREATFFPKEQPSLGKANSGFHIHMCIFGMYLSRQSWAAKRNSILSSPGLTWVQGLHKSSPLRQSIFKCSANKFFVLLVNYLCFVRIGLAVLRVQSTLDYNRLFLNFETWSSHTST